MAYRSPGMNMSSETLKFAELDLLDPTDAARAAKKVYGGRDFKRGMERELLTNLDFWEGGVKSWMKWSERDNKRILDPSIPDDELLINFNLILEVGETIVSRLIRHDPVASARPISSDHRDVARARMLSDLLRYYYTTGLDMVITLAAFIKLLLCSPVAWMTGGWNPSEGEIISTSFDDFLATRMEDAFPGGLDSAPPEERLQVISDTQGEFAQLFGADALRSGDVKQHAGDLCAELISVSNMCWYPWRVKTWKEVEFYVHTTEPTVDQVADRYDLSVEDVRKRAYGSSRGRAGHPQILDGRPSSRISGSWQGNQNAETVLHHEFYAKATLKYPEGVQGVLLGNDDEALKVHGIQNKCHQMPFFPLVQHDIPEQAWGTCLVSQIRSAQMDINKAASQESMYRDKMIFPTILVPEEGVIDTDDWEFSNQPGEQRKYQGGPNNRPSTLERPSLSLDYIRSIDRNVTFIREMSSVSAIQAGKTDDAHVRSGRAVNALDEKTSERMIEFGKKLNKHQSRFWTFQATELQYHPTGQRVAQILGEDNQLEVIEWTRDALRPTSWETPNRLVALVHIEAVGNEMPSSRSEMRNTVMALTKAGWLRPGEHDAEMWKMIGGGETRYFQDRQRKDRVRQVWEIEQWRKGQLTAGPLAQQEHQVHLDELYDWIRGGNEYHELVESFPYIHDHIQHHIRMHQMLLFIEKAKLEFMAERAKAEAWLTVRRELVRDVELGSADPEILEMVEGDGPAPGILPFASVLMGQGLPDQVGPEPAPEGGQAGTQAAPASTPIQQQRGGVGEGEGRDRRRDLADSGVDRGNLVTP